MGQTKSIEDAVEDSGKDVNFNSFRILRSIGKGSFGKVCMVQKISSDHLFAMKYLNKASCVEQDFVENVRREISILRRLKHDYIVNLWYTFQDEEDFFIVVDLLMGGDLRYHLSKHVVFSEDDVRTYLIEMASVLDYLRTKCIIHRDIKPDNILLDEKGHAHLTDFNVAVHLKSRESLASAYAGTKPYIAPDICKAKLGDLPGYSFNVDWWSLGVTLYELLRHKRPFKISDETSVEDCMDMYLDGKVSFSTSWSDALTQLFLKLFVLDGEERLSTMDELMKQEFAGNTVLGETAPIFIPSNKHLNYDPTYELEEMMIESKPLHKKKQRLRKQRESRRRSRKEHAQSQGGAEGDKIKQGSIDENFSDKFITFNRELEGNNTSELKQSIS